MKRGIWIGTAVVVLVVAAVPLWLVLDDGGGERRAGAFSSGQTVAANWKLSIAGAAAGPVQSVSGCGIDAEIINEAAGPDAFVHKHIGQPRYDACVIQVGLSMSPAFYDWIRASFASNYQRKGVVLQQFDPVTGGEKLKLELFETLLTGVRLPRLDAADTNPVWLSVTLVPEHVQRSAGTGAKAGTVGKAEPMSAATFKLSLPDQIAVKSVEPWAFKVAVAAEELGDARDYLLEPTKPEFDNLVVGVPENSKTTAAIASLDNWFTSFVIQGNNTDAQERPAMLSVASAGGKMLTFNFNGVGIFGADPFAGADGSRRYGFYVESATVQGP